MTAGMTGGTGRGSIHFMPKVDLADYEPQERRAAVFALDTYTAGTTVQVDVGDLEPFDPTWPKEIQFHPGTNVVEALNELGAGGLQVLLSGTPRVIPIWHDALRVEW